LAEVGLTEVWLLVLVPVVLVSFEVPAVVVAPELGLPNDRSGADVVAWGETEPGVPIRSGLELAEVVEPPVVV